LCGEGRGGMRRREAEEEVERAILAVHGTEG